MTEQGLIDMLKFVAAFRPEAEAFARGYAERSRATVDELSALGCRVVPCHCGGQLGSCSGWQMLHGDALADYLAGTGGV